MDSFTVIAYLDDGPRAGQTLSVHTGPDGQPPSQVVAPEPRGPGEAAQESIEVGHGLDRTTTYHLHAPATADNTYIYRTGEPQ